MTNKLVIFDCDGVLVDSELTASRVFAQALSTYGYHISTEESIRKFSGVNEHSVREIIKQESSIDLPANYWDIHQPSLKAAYQIELVPLMQPILELLQSLKITRCVASNSNREHVSHCLELSKQKHYFAESSIFTAQQVARPKPAPDLFLLAAKKMGFEAKDCLVVEDSIAGTKAAIEAGMDVCVFLGGSHTRYAWYRENIAKYSNNIVSSCQELAHVMQKTLLAG